MNDDYATNIHSCSDSVNNRNGDGNGNQYQISQVWGTWEELLLTCAVKRHGSKDWDSVAKEVVSRSSLDASAPSCRLKYQDLKRRFRDSVDDDGGRGNSDGEIPWLEQLRSLRVAELRRDVQRCDESILSLQLKVKKLEEEEKDGDDVRSINDETEPTRLNRETNESNSTPPVDKIADHERLSGDSSINPDPDQKTATEEEEEGTVSRRSGMSHSGELGESGTYTGHRKRKGHEYMSGEDNSIRGESGGNIKPDGSQSQPLIEIIKMIRSHPRGSVFEYRLRSQGTLAQGFIGQNRRSQYEKELERGRIYTLTTFYASNSKVMYHVADQRLVICISHDSALSKDEEDVESILTERFRVHSFSDFEANCDLRGDLHDVVGHLKLVDGQALHQRPVLCTNDGSVSRKVTVHLQLKDGPVVNVYLWDEAAESFRLKFDASATTPTVLLVTTVNPKRLGGKLCLSSMSSSRVFLDEDVDPTSEYLTWLSANPSATSLVNPVEVVKAETLTISEIAAFLKREPAKVAYFDCIATIDDVKLGAEWYYIACKDCQTKLNRGPTTLLCPKCRNEDATALANYRVELSVYDNEEQCTFIILGDAGKELTGRKASELIDAYVQENGGDEAALEVPLPQCFIDTIGQTKKFRIKVSPYNFTSTRLSLTATKIISPAVLPPKNTPLSTPLSLLGAQNHRPGAEVGILEVAESSGSGTSATDDQKGAKRFKRSG